MEKALSDKIGKESAQERLIKYFVYKEPELLGKNKPEHPIINNLNLNLNYLIEFYKKSNRKLNQSKTLKRKFPNKLNERCEKLLNYSNSNILNWNYNSRIMCS